MLTYNTVQTAITTTEASTTQTTEAPGAVVTAAAPNNAAQSVTTNSTATKHKNADSSCISMPFLVGTLFASYKLFT